MSKKITYYKVLRKPGSRERFPNNVHFVESTGTPAEITSRDGLTIQLALEYAKKDRVWYATDITTGLSSWPVADRSKDKLLERLAGYDWKPIQNSEQNKTLRELLKAHKEEIE